MLSFAVVTAAEETAPRTVRFAVFAARPIENLAFTPRPKAEPEALVFYPTARSPHYEWRGTIPLRFSDAVTHTVVAEVMIPAEMHDALLLFVPLESPAANGLRYQVMVMDDGAGSQPVATLSIVNLSRLELSGTIGSQPIALKAGLNSPFPIQRSARVALRTNVKGRSYQSYADTIELRSSERALLFFFPPFYKGSVEVQSRLLIDAP